MRRVILAAGADGKSFFQSDEELSLHSYMQSSADGDLLTGTSQIVASHDAALANGEALISRLWATDETLLDQVLERTGKGTLNFNWSHAVLGPNCEMPFHRTQTIDIDHILKGDIELAADDRSVRLHPGDTAIILGAFHSWKTFDEPCTFLRSNSTRSEEHGFQFRD